MVIFNYKGLEGFKNKRVNFVFNGRALVDTNHGNFDFIYDDLDCTDFKFFMFIRNRYVPRWYFFFYINS